MKIKNAVDIDAKKIVHNGCMITYTGEVIDLMNPKENNYLIEDIAHHLAYICRWNGATKTYLSVAEHCCMMFDMVPEAHKATALFHDCEEAYWGDIIKPVKNLLPDEMRQRMREMRALIFEKFSVPAISEVIEKVDFELLQFDFQNTILTSNHIGMSCYEAEKEWLYRYHSLKTCADNQPDYKAQVRAVFPDSYIGKFEPDEFGVILHPDQDEDFMCVDTSKTEAGAWQLAYEKLKKKGVL